MAEVPRRHCWECRRRHLVCDFGVPTCERCTKSGTTCPGYGEKPPLRLRWVTPGEVKSRNAKQPTNDSSIKGAKGSLALTRGLPWALTSIDQDNARIYPTLLHLIELAPNSSIYPISPANFQNGLKHPDYLRLVIVCMSISHQMHQHQERGYAFALLPRFLHYRGIMIRSLIREMGKTPVHAVTYVVAGMLTLLLVDAHQGDYYNWRPHIHGALQVIHLHGGVAKFAQLKGARPLLSCIMMCFVFGNTTSPASDLASNPQYLNGVDYTLLTNLGDDSAFPWPRALFVEVLRINHLRILMHESIPARAVHLLESQAASLSRIGAFSPDAWGAAKPSGNATWTLLANVYRDAVALYCLLALHDLEPPSQGEAQREARVGLAELLRNNLQKALALPSVQRFVVWPLIVLGVQAGTGRAALRFFVAEELRGLARLTGTHAPRAISDVLEAAWRSDKMNWDCCFDRSYFFSIQMAIDLNVQGASMQFGRAKSPGSYDCPIPDHIENLNGGNFVGTLSFYHFNMIVSGACTAVVLILTFSLMGRHANRMSKPEEQIKIMRIINMIPSYQALSFVSICLPESYIYLQGFTEVFQGIALYAFLMLLCDFLAPTKQDKVEFFSSLEVKKQWQPNKMRNGLVFLRLTWWSVLQYPIVTWIAAVAQVVTQFFHRYCLGSNEPHFSHVWITAATSLSTSVAVNAIIQFYTNFREYMKEHQPLTKLLAFKLIVGLVVLEKIIFLILEGTRVLHTSEMLTYVDVMVGLPEMIFCLQMFPLTLFVLYAYRTKPYEVVDTVGPEMPPLQECHMVTSGTDGEALTKEPCRCYQGGWMGLYAWAAYLSPIGLFADVVSAHRMISNARDGQKTQTEDPKRSFEDLAEYGSRNDDGGWGVSA